MGANASVRTRADLTATLTREQEDRLLEHWASVVIAEALRGSTLDGAYRILERRLDWGEIVCTDAGQAFLRDLARAASRARREASAAR